MAYEMHTDAGNAVVEDIVGLSLKYQLSWPTVQGMLGALAQEQVFAEATDTAVREAVYRSIFL
jgi:hypothetical protein